jgi:hypothetical protein
VARMMAMLEDWKQKQKTGDDQDDDEDEDDGAENGTDASAWAQGRILSRGCDGDLDEWQVVGMSYQITRHPQLPNAPQ